MRRVDIAVLSVAGSLATFGFLSGLILAILHGVQENKWGYLVVFSVIVVFGIAVLRPVLKQLFSIIRESEGLEKKEEEV